MIFKSKFTFIIHSDFLFPLESSGSISEPVYKRKRAPLFHTLKYIQNAEWKWTIKSLYKSGRSTFSVKEKMGYLGSLRRSMVVIDNITEWGFCFYFEFIKVCVVYWSLFFIGWEDSGAIKLPILSKADGFITGKILVSEVGTLFYSFLHLTQSSDVWNNLHINMSNNLFVSG